MKSDKVQLDQMMQNRILPDGGFSEMPGGVFRPDSTAWAVLALSKSEEGSSLVDPARRQLAAAQLDDGRVSISPDHPETHWPTSVCILAWQGSPAFGKALSNATRFLLATAGAHWQKHPDSPLAHDTSLQGWPWVAGAHSWVEPTALALLSLRAVGQGSHPRVTDAVAMLLDRQLSSGGWNYGNTFVFGHELQAMPDATGLALQSLAGLVPQEKIERSLRYLGSGVQHLRTPFSLAWALLGLGAWRARPACAESLISACLERQALYGEYTTSQLSLLDLARLAHAGLGEILL